MNFKRSNIPFTTSAALSLLIAFGVFQAARPAFAGLINEPDPSLGAKVNQNVKTGVRYWIELKRRGRTSHVTNQQKFITGDQIKFHVQATVDGYAYIVLRSGSQGEQAVLFPLEKSMDNNKLNRETDYALPADDYLTFDAHPGTEKVTLLFSKSALDPTKVMAATFKDSNHVVLRAPSHGATGSKDLIPARTTVTYQTEEALTRGDSRASSFDSVNGAKPDQGMIDSVIAMSSSSPGSANGTSQSATSTLTQSSSTPSESELALSRANLALKNTDMTPGGTSSSALPSVATADSTKASSAPFAVTAMNNVSSTAFQPQTNSNVDPNDADKKSTKFDPRPGTASNAKTESSSSNQISMTNSNNLHVAAGVDVKSSTGAVIVRQDDPDKVLHIDVDLEHSGS